MLMMLDRLAEKGLITRTRSQTDRRKQLLNATAQGRDLVRKIRPMIDRAEQRMLAPLSPSARRKFMEMLTQLVNVNNVYSRAPLDRELLFGLTGRHGYPEEEAGRCQELTSNVISCAEFVELQDRYRKLAGFAPDALRSSQATA
jgi:hypothetical protein